MEKNNVVKKVICFAVCIVLLIIALVFSGGTGGVTAGKGRGTDAKITSLEQFSDLFSRLSQSSAVAAVDSKAVAVAERKQEKEYTSFTMHETSNIKVSADSYIRGNTYSSSRNKTVLRRTIDYYYTEDAVYYSADMIFATTYTTEKSGESKTVKSSVSLNMDLYLGANYALLRFNRFLSSVTDSDFIGTDNIIGKWFKFEEGDSVVSSLISVNDYNSRFLNLLSGYLKSYYEKGFDKSGDVYKLSNSAFKSFVKSALSIYGASSSGSDEDMDGELIVDIEDATKPQVSFGLKEEYKDSENNANYSYSIEMNAKESDVLEFMNINNTIVNIPKNINTYSVEDLKECIGG